MSTDSPTPPDGPAMPAKRPYLHSEERRQQLLAVALVLVDRMGLSHLTISQVALEAGVTRQTAYHHFNDMNDLFREVLRARFMSMQGSVAEAIAASGTDFRGAVRRAAEIGIDLPLRDRQLLRYVFGGLEADRPELKATLHELRGLLILRWCFILYPDQVATPMDRATIWAVMNALFGLYDLLETGEVTRDQAVEIVMALSLNTLDSLPR
ncbi:MAG TPA: TetR/AcrR family transcriptional regulator [Acidimicrobiales bacterium]|nr:TetR/AcrR family transcriptional regulator [Acidimicrobiales bacterium]